MKRAIFLFLLTSLSSMEIGNPAQPYLQKKGVILQSEGDWSFRLAYLDDYVYRMRFREEFEKLASYSATPVFVKLATNAGLVTLNLFNRLDVYGILGTAQLQVGQVIYTKRELAWGVGGKILLAKIAKISFGIDMKFFTTSQQPLFFAAGGNAYNIVNEYRMNYWEIQGAFGTSYRTKFISPYLHLTYLISKLDPQPMIALVRLPSDPVSVDAETKPVIGHRRWGMAVGATLLGSPKATLTVESRFINQNAIDICGELRF